VRISLLVLAAPHVVRAFSAELTMSFLMRHRGVGQNGVDKTENIPALNSRCESVVLSPPATRAAFMKRPSLFCGRRDGRRVMHVGCAKFKSWEQRCDEICLMHFSERVPPHSDEEERFVAAALELLC